ncbi:hypothetical protein SADUNF_Sadunf18G0036200 [Salix dunnii]|uniref:Uncharacterized protein n=1 Tax=Salix dunnii TaxID=1413687 RepID=A0A835J3R4_9ROSI|nr:hypothetical protein SADUNF_Sadunf18G0036200 [Salix dunnii]
MAFKEFITIQDDICMRNISLKEFGALINEFQYSHTLISIDGSHIYSKYKENLLVTSAYYMNNSVYPYVLILPKKTLKMCTDPFKQELDILYEDLVETNDITKAWLKVEPKDGHYHVILELFITVI